MILDDFLRGFGGLAGIGGLGGGLLGGLGGLRPHYGGLAQEPLTAQCFHQSAATLQEMASLRAENAQLRGRVAELEKILKMTSVKEQVSEGSVIPIHDWTEE